MSDNSSIEWCDASWSPITGCTRVSAGCDHCYSAALSKRLAAMGQKKYQGIVGNGHFNGVVKTWDDELSKPLKWKKPKTIFVNSMSDTFHKDVPFEFIDKIFAVMALCPHHTFQVLTKRPERMAEYLNTPARHYAVKAATACFPIEFSEGRRFMLRELERTNRTDDWWPLTNCWLGTSVEDQQRADERIPHLRDCPAAVRFLSVEPMLGSINLGLFREDRGFRRSLHWVIVGGESGHNARPCNVAWIRDIVDQCEAAGVPCFVKQLGSRPYSDADKIGHRGMDYKALIPGRRTAPIFWRFLNDRKGGDIEEFPDDLKVRQFPTTAVPQ